MNQSNEVTSLRSRYIDAYRVATVVVGVGNFVKTLGIIIGLLIAVGAFVIFGDPQNSTIFFGGVLLGVFLASILFAIGVLVSAQGQILRASLDSAISVSPFLTNDLRSEIMFRQTSGSKSSKVTMQGSWVCVCGYQNSERPKCLDCDRPRQR